MGKVKLILSCGVSWSLFAIANRFTALSKCCDKAALKLSKVFAKEAKAICPRCEEKADELVKSSDELLKKLS